MAAGARNPMTNEKTVKAISDEAMAHMGDAERPIEVTGCAYCNDSDAFYLFCAPGPEGGSRPWFIAVCVECRAWHYLVPAGGEIMAIVRGERPPNVTPELLS